MGKYLKIDKVDAEMIMDWFECFEAEGKVYFANETLAKKIKNFIDSKEQDKCQRFVQTAE